MVGGGYLFFSEMGDVCGIPTALGTESFISTIWSAVPEQADRTAITGEIRRFSPTTWKTGVPVQSSW